MANVRYSGGGTSATLGTKTIDENGIYNASSDDLDGYNQVTVEVPQPSGDLAMTLTENAVYDGVDVKDYASATITVDVPIPPEPQTQSKSITANITQQTVTPDTGYTLSSVIVNPQKHDLTFTPNSNTANNDMGQIHDYRYVDTSGMIEPSGTKSVTYDTNGSHSEDVSQYANISVEVDVPVSGDLGTKSIIANGTYRALDDNLDGYSEVDVNVPQNATLGIKSITANGNYYAVTDGYDGYSRVDVAVPGASLQTSKTITATTSQQTVTPDYGYDALEQVIVDPQVHTQTYTPAANTAANDMGVQNNYRYVNTSGLITPSGTKSITANGTGIDVTTYAAVDVTVTPPSITPSNANPVALTANSPITPTANGYAIESYSSITPSNSSPATITSGSIYKASANGKAVATVTNVTPSSTPTSVSTNDIVKIGGSGVIVDSIPTPPSITPSNISPVALTANQAVKPTSSGYAIGSYDTVTPSDTNPPLLDYPYVYKPTGSGFLYSTPQPKVKVDTVTLSTSSNTAVNIGFNPKYICMYSPTSYYSNIYNEDISTTSYIRATSSGPLLKAFNSNYNGGLASLMTNGFICRPCTTSVGLDWYYIAIG